MGIWCVTCEQDIHGDVKTFQKHIAERSHTAPYYCSEGDCCKRKFALRDSLIRHIKDHHLDTISSSSSTFDSDSPPLPASPILSTDSVASEESFASDSQEYDHESVASVHEDAGESDVNSSNFYKAIEKAAALMILNLLKRGNVPGTAISAMISETGKFIAEVLNITKQEISHNLRSCGVDNEIIAKSVTVVSVPDPFRKLHSKEQQLNYFNENFSLVRPDSLFLRYRYDQRLDSVSGNFETKQVVCSFQNISVIKTLTAVLNNPVLYRLIQQEKISTDGKIRSFLDGSIAKENPLIVNHPNTIRIVLYSDDFECVNPLGSKTSVHKIVGVYYYIQNLPPEENSRLRSIHVAAYGYREDLHNEKGIDTFLEPFLEEMKQLESNTGVPIEVNGEPYTLRACLVACTADTLAAHEMLGLASPSSNRFCAQCLVTRQDLHKNIFANGEKRTRDFQLRLVEELKTNAGHVKTYYGVERDCLLLREPKYAEFPDAFMKDSMHDILRGIAQVEIKLTLRHFLSKKYFGVEFLNSRLESFDYGLPDIKNKPSANFTTSTFANLKNYTLHQTAAQTWCFIRIFPFLFGSRVPSSDEHLQLMVLLKRICDIVFSAELSESEINNLESLIYDHHSLFFKLYPPPPVDEETEELEEHDEEDLNLHSNAPPASQSDAIEDEDSFMETATTSASGNRLQSNLTTSSAVRRRLEQKVVRPVNKHHHLLHYPDQIRKYGPSVLYWCMRLEAKHAIAKRFASICCNYQNLPLTFADLHQINHAAELLEMTSSLKEELSFSRGIISTVDDSEHRVSLCGVGLKGNDVVEKVDSVTVGGFEYRDGMYIALPITLNTLPLFGRIISMYASESVVYLVTEDFESDAYNACYGAYLIHTATNGTIRAFRSASLPPHRPMVLWFPFDSNTPYLSPRSSFTDSLLSGV